MTGVASLQMQKDRVIEILKDDLQRADKSIKQLMQENTKLNDIIDDERAVRRLLEERNLEIRQELDIYLAMAEDIREAISNTKR